LPQIFTRRPFAAFNREDAMFGRLMPKEGRFFDLFNEHAEQIVQGSRELAALMASGDDLERRARNIESVEKRADKIARSTIELLHKTFITPLDREDIHHLISKMDDILDLIEDSSQLMFLYDVNVPTPEAKKLADICVVCCEKVKNAVALLSNMDNAAEILLICADIDRLESEADHVMRAAIARLFRDEPDVRELIKLRSVYEHLETVTDRCEDVANIIQGIVLENS
jgi:predicted phosphate transport protein (TIGR00153 family)